MNENKASKKLPEMVKGKKRSWVKAHLYCCCKTNAFVAVKVTKGNVSDKDTTVIRGLMRKPSKLFDMKEFVADKAYAGRPVYRILEELHITPFIPFMRKSGGSPKGVQLWRTCYNEFYTNTEEFMKKYHKRSNIETANHMLKQKFGDHLRTRIFNENVNEVKMRVLCHNMCVLIQEIFERNIEVDFTSCVKKFNSVQK